MTVNYVIMTHYSAKPHVYEEDETAEQHNWYYRTLQGRQGCGVDQGSKEARRTIGLGFYSKKEVGRQVVFLQGENK